MHVNCVAHLLYNCAMDPVHDPEWTPSRMDTISNEHNPEWTRSRMSTYNYIVT